MHEEKRRAPRAQCDHQANFEILLDGRPPSRFDVRVVDVSSLGARIEIRGATWNDISWIESKIGRLTIQILNKQLDLPSKVVWVKPSPLEAGLFFTKHEELEFDETFNELIASI